MFVLWFILIEHSKRQTNTKKDLLKSYKVIVKHLTTVKTFLNYKKVSRCK